MGLGDFLFQGSAPIPAPTGSDTSTAFPLWLQTGIFDAISGAANLAQQPYTPFPGPTVAAPSSATTAAQNLAQNNVGAWQPYVGAAGALNAYGAQGAIGAQQQASQNAGIWQPYLNQAGAITGSAVPAAGNAQNYAYSTVNDWLPAINQAGALNARSADLAGQGANIAMENRGIGQPYLNQAGALTAGAAQSSGQAQQQLQRNNGAWAPYLGAAGGLTAAGAAPLDQSAINAYVNPFEDYITGALNRNLMQNILPKVQDRFIGSGQSASPQDAELTAQSIYGTQQAAGQALATSYQQAVQDAEQQRQRMLQAGSQFGALGQLRQSLNLGQTAAELQAAQQQGEFGQQYGALGQLAQSMGSQNLQDMLAAASAHGNAAGQAGQLGALTSQLTGSQIGQILAPSQYALQAGQQYGALGQAAQSMGANDINTLIQTIGAGTGVAQQSATLGALNSQLGAVDVGQLAASGQQQDTLSQANLNAALNRFQQEQQWPYQNVAFLSDIIRGIPVQAAGSTTQTAGTTYPSSYGPSAFSSFLGTAGLGSALGLKRGGHVKASHFRRAA